MRPLQSDRRAHGCLGAVEIPAAVMEAGQRQLNHRVHARLAVIGPYARRLAKQRDTLHRAAADAEVAGERRRHGLNRIAIARLHGVPPGGANVFELDVDRLERRGLAHFVIADVPEPQSDVFAKSPLRRRLVGHVVAGALLYEGVQREAAVVVRAQQRLVGKGRQHRQPGGRYLLGGLARERCREHRQPRQALLLERVEEPPGMLEARAYAAVAIEHPPVAFEQVDRSFDFTPDLRDRKHADPGSGEFDRERHAVEQPRQRSNVRSIAAGVESGRGGVRAQLEQLDGVERPNRLRFRLVRVRHSESVQGKQPFTARRQAGARRDQQLDRRTGPRQPFDERRQLAEVFGVVEDKQLLRPAAQRREELLEPIRRIRRRQPKRSGDAWHDLLDSRQVLEPDPVNGDKLRLPLPDQCLCEATLADAARTRQRQHAAFLAPQQCIGLPQFGTATDEPRVGRRRRCRRPPLFHQQRPHACRRCDSDLLRQPLAEPLDRASGFAVASLRSYGLDRRGQRVFVQRIERQPVPRNLLALRGIAQLLQSLPRRCTERRCQPVALEAQPFDKRLSRLVFEAVAECTAVRREGARPILPRTGGFEIAQVGIHAPAQRIGAHLQPVRATIADVRETAACEGCGAPIRRRARARAER